MSVSVPLEYGRIFNSTPSLLLLLAADENFTVVGATDAYLRATGLTREAIVGRPAAAVLADLQPDHDAPDQLLASLRAVVASGQPDAAPGRSHSVRGAAADGDSREVRHGSFLNSPVIAEDGALAWIIHRADDVTDLVRARQNRESVDQERRRAGALLEAAAAAQRNRAADTEQADRERRFYHAILSSTPDLVYVFNLEHRFIYANDALLHMWGRTRETALGRNCLELGYEPWHAAMHDREIDQVIATRQPIRGEVPFTGTDGRRIYDYIFVPVFAADGTVEAVAGTTRDVTEMARARETVAERRAELERLVAERTSRLREAVEQMEEFSYTISHDLRSPARAMRGYAEVLLQDHGHRLDADGRELLNRIERSGSRMDRLIQDLLTYSRISRREIRLEPVPLDRLIRDVMEQYPELQPDRARIDLPPALPSVVAHEPSLSQVVSNLLTNAVKFVPPGRRPHVRVSIARPEDTVRLTFADNGIGIAPEHQVRLFGMFERVHVEGHFEGTGVGLAIVRKAMERMNGRAGMESDGRNGSRFWIELPAAPTR